MKKQVMSGRKRKMWLGIRRIFTAAAVVILVTFSCNSSITVESNGKIYEQNIKPFEKSTIYENSTLFQQILQEEVRGITRLAVIKSQMETDGGYNGQRRIEIAHYAHRQEKLPMTTVGAEFYLDDLIKWGNYGFVKQPVYATEDELNSYFANGSSDFSMQKELTQREWKEQSEKTREMLRKIGGEQNEETLSMRMLAELPQSSEEYEQMTMELGKVVNKKIREMDILLPRYLSVEGKDLAEYASNIEEYMQLCADLEATSKGLFYNFTEYSENKGYYTPGATNIRYCYRMNVDGEIRYFTNLEGDFSKRKLEEITQQFEQFGRYVYYNADRSEIMTNTGLSADFLKQELGYYQYAYGDNTRVWLAVDTGYPVNDGLRQARDAYNSRLLPYYGYLAFAFVLFVVLSICLLVHLTRYEGRKEADEGGYTIALYRSDGVLTEFFVALGTVWLVCMLALGWLGYSFCLMTWEDAVHRLWFPYAVGASVWLLDYVLMYLYLGFVRRCKAHTLWRNSLLRLILHKISEGIVALYDNSSILIRTMLPFGILLLLNLVLGGMETTGIFAAAALDVLAIWLLYQREKTLHGIVEQAKQIGEGQFDLKIDSSRMHGENRKLACVVNGIGDGIRTAVEKSMKDERLKADLITNVSHDIKTPLTSIINFVNLLKREKIEEPRIRGYLDVLDKKSQRLKQLTDDLVEASKISSGNISLQMERINFAELVNQTCGEFADRLKEKCLEPVLNLPEAPVYIEADPRRIWRVVENLFTNVCKYALEGTRVYLDIRQCTVDGKKVAVFSMKNISAQALNISADELTERFIRGDISRSTEGSGLGLSIAKNLTQLQKGTFEIYLDGDLFKVALTFPSEF